MRPPLHTATFAGMNKKKTPTEIIRETVRLKGIDILLKGEMPEVGELLPDFTVVRRDFKEASLYDIELPVKVVLSVPSLETSTCAMETRKFNEQLGKLKNVACMVVSKDLPFAQKRFCEVEGIENVMAVSDFRYGDFGTESGMEMVNGPLKGLLARAVFVLDTDNRVHYAELVSEVSSEPDYEAALNAVKTLLGGERK